MRLISNFHDYYDGCTTNIDPLHTYNRVSRKIYLTNQYFRDLFNNPVVWCGSLHPSTFVIGFCGKLYVGIRTIGHITCDSTVDGYYYSLDEYLKSTTQNKYSNEQGEYTFSVQPKLSLKDWFIEYDTPCFVAEWYYRETILTINPCLREYHFAKVVDPWTAYQEVQMFVGNDLAKQQDKMVKLSDKTLQQKNGFNNMSFKNRKN